MTIARTLLAAAGLAVLAAAARAETGALTALGRDGTSRAACPLRHTDVRATVSGFVARVVVTQEFANPLAEPVEALYTFPLSERAAVDAMEMRTGGRVVHGTVKERDEARRLYEAARAAGQLAGLLDQERPNVFTQSLANLMPGATVAVRLEYVEPLLFERGRFEFAFPTVVGPRFVPPGRVADPRRVTPPVTPEGTRTGHDVAIAVDVDAGMPIGEIASPLHAIEVVRRSPRRARVRLRDRATIPNRDFVLRWSVAGTGVQSAVLAHRRPGEDGYATFVLVPPARVPAAEAAPKELVFVVDRSGSQSGEPLEKAKETLRFILAHMNPQDTFQIVSFSNATETLFERPQPASPAMKRQARRYVDALEANGGTYMAEAVARVCAMPADGNRLRIVTFMTDGYVGNDLEVLGLVRRLRGTSRWFPFGTGSAVNRFLIDGMARLGGGEAEVVLPGEPGDAVAQRFWERIAAPVLTDVRVELEGLDVVQVFPSAPADLWAERPLVLQARYRRPGSGRVVLRGFRQGRPWEQALAVTLPEAAAAHAPIASMWARAKVDDLMAQDLEALQRGTYPEALRQAIVEVALAHRLLTPFTSFVAVEDRVVNAGGGMRTVEVPVEMPQGVRYEGIFGARAEQAPAPGAPAGFTTRSPGGAGMRQKAAGEARAATDEPAWADASPARRLDEAVRRKLDASLQRLAATNAGGWVRVRIRLRDDRAATVRAVEALGLAVTAVSGRTVEGVAAVERLEALARAGEVERVEAAIGG